MRIERTEVPPSGFNSYDCWGIDINEERAFKLIDAFVQKLKPHGFDYFCFDAGWFCEPYYRERYLNKGKPEEKNLDEFGRWQPAHSKFPHGLKPISDRCHENGLKFGVHIMRGVPRLAIERGCTVKGTSYSVADIADFDDDCPWGTENVGVNMDKPGAQEYYNSVIESLAEHGVDFIKVDDMAEHPREIEAISEAIDRVERPILLSLSPGNYVYKGNMPHIRKYGNMIRISGDIWDRGWDLQVAFDCWENWENEGSNECWLDLDMIPFGLLQAYIPEDFPKDHVPHDLNEKRLSRLTEVEKQTFMTQRALAASPLFFGGELTMTPDEDIAIATNPEMLRCNRNGLVGKRIYGERHIDIRQVFKRGSTEHGWLAVFNRKGRPYKFSVPVSAFGIKDEKQLLAMRDIWTGEKLNIVDGKAYFNMEICQCFFAEF